MRKRVFCFILLFFAVLVRAGAAEYSIDDRFINKALYKNIYPSTLNNTKNDVNSSVKKEVKKIVKINTKNSTKIDDMKVEDIKRDNVKKDDTKIDDTKDTKTSDIKSADIKTAEIKSNNVTKDQATPNAITPKVGAIKSVNRRIIKRPNRARISPSPRVSAQKKNSVGSDNIRRVVSRVNTARSGTNKNLNSAQSNATTNSKYRIVARSAVQGNRTRSINKDVTINTSESTPMSSQQCFANYKECMDRYCERDDTPYNRCYCSAKLAQIDSKYQNKIDSLVQQIIRLQYKSNVSSDEIKNYWDATVGTYTNTNPWTTIDNALDIDWTSTESRVRGQNAFVTGHSYCVNYLKSCSYMASNLRDAYKSEIERDCTAYEKGLSRIQMAAESVIESYNQ